MSRVFGIIIIGLVIVAFISGVACLITWAFLDVVSPYAEFLLVCGIAGTFIGIGGLLMLIAFFLL